MTALSRIAIGQRLRFEAWHYRLEAEVPANAIANIFYHARIREEDGAIVFKDSSMAARAEKYRGGVERVFGKGVVIDHERPTAVPPVTGRPYIHVPVK